MKFLSLLIPALLSAQISNDLFRDCSNGKKKACAEIGLTRMNISSPDYNPSLALSYLESGCNVSANSCVALYRYYDKKGDTSLSLSYLKKACDLGSYCSDYHSIKGN